jgi:hypothetical protein
MSSSGGVQRRERRQLRTSEVTCFEVMPLEKSLEGLEEGMIQDSEPIGVRRGLPVVVVALGYRPAKEKDTTWSTSPHRENVPVPVAPSLFLASRPLDHHTMSVVPRMKDGPAIEFTTRPPLGWGRGVGKGRPSVVASVLPQGIQQVRPSRV